MAELNCLYWFLSQKEKNLLLQQAVELILRMVAKLGILGLVSRSLGGKSFCLQETWENCHKHLECHLKTEPNCELRSQTMACSQWASCPCGCGPYNTYLACTGTHWMVLVPGLLCGLWECAWPCEEIYCFTVLGRQVQVKIANFHPCQASNNS